MNKWIEVVPALPRVEAEKRFRDWKDSNEREINPGGDEGVSARDMKGEDAEETMQLRGMLKDGDEPQPRRG